MEFPVLILSVIFTIRIGVNSATANNGTRVTAFPEGFKFGVATAAFQIEGAWNVSEDHTNYKMKEHLSKQVANLTDSWRDETTTIRTIRNKSRSIWDVYTKKPSTVADGSTAEDACKSYQFYKRDIQMIKFLGVDFYRFSISWPRLFPNGFTNKISEDGKRYYNNLIDELIANGIDPVVTMYHWDLPQSLQDLGGWTNPLIVDWFEDYARGLYILFGDRVKTWVTVNEPKQITIFSYGMTRFAPGLNMSGVADYMAVKYLLLAHARAWHVYDEEFRATQKGQCGITIAVDFRMGASNASEDVEAGLYAMDFEVGLYSHPIFSTKGGWPDRVVTRVLERSMEQGFQKSRLPEFSLEEIEYIKGTSDFFGMNHYSTRFYTPYTPGMYAVPSYNDDVGGASSYLDYKPAVVIHSTSIPHGIEKALLWVRDNCNNPSIIITENGYSTLSGLQDAERVAYLRDYLQYILAADCKVVGYTAWSLLDNFEWDSGFSVKFGLFEVDFEASNRTRTARSSALWYKHTVATRSLDLDYEPELIHISF